jgi:hypothetical protein
MSRNNPAWFEYPEFLERVRKLTPAEFTHKRNSCSVAARRMLWDRAARRLEMERRLPWVTAA